MSGQKRAKGRFGCLGKLLVLFLLAAVFLFLAADYVFSIRSNLSYYTFQNSAEPLEIQLANGSWKLASTLTVAEMDFALHKQAESTGASWKTLNIRRKANGMKQNVVQAIFGAEVCVMEFQPQHFTLATSFQEKFALTTSRERLRADNAAFAITGNFRDPQGKPLGLVVHEGQQKNGPFPAWTGYFFVKDGKPWFGPKSLFEDTPGVLQEASQGYPSVMKNHTVFSYVDMSPNRYYDGDKITYRALAGMRQNGTIVFIVSGKGGVMNVAEVTALAQKLNVQHATLLDGGRALQYSMHLAGLTHHFSAFNTLFDFNNKTFELQKSPVFITVKPIPKIVEEE